MTTVSFESFVPDVLMYAPNCPEFTALHTLRLTAIDFCTDTQWWKYKSDPIDLTAGESEYPIEVPSGAEPVAVVAAWYQHRPLFALGHSAKNKWQALDLDSQDGPPVFWSQRDTGNLVLSPVPKVDEPGALVVECSVRPLRTAASTSKDLMNRWYDELVSGALSRLYAIPNQPYTNQELAILRDRMYREGITKGKIDANKSLTSASLRVQPRRA